MCYEGILEIHFGSVKQQLVPQAKGPKTTGNIEKMYLIKENSLFCKTGKALQ